MEAVDKISTKQRKKSQHIEFTDYTISPARDLYSRFFYTVQEEINNRLSVTRYVHVEYTNRPCRCKNFHK